MELTNQQLDIIKAWIVANVPNATEHLAKAALDAAASPAFHVLRTDVLASEIFDQITWANYTPADAADSTVIWSNRSLACQGKQFNLQIMLQGQPVFNATKILLRAGLNDATTNLPSGAGGISRSGGWAAILVILRRQANVFEKLFAIQTSGVGVNAGDALGATTNPALLVFEGNITLDQTIQAMNRP
jgi:hypothetical protein